MIWQEPQIRRAFSRPPEILERFQVEWNERSKQYPISEEQISIFSNIVEQIETKGYTVIPNFFKNIDTLANKVQERFATGNGTKNNEKEEEISDEPKPYINLKPI